MMHQENLDGPLPVAPALPPNLFARVVDGMNGAGSLLIFAVMLLVGADVLSRNLFNAPIAGVAEMVAASIVAIMFLQLASALRHGRMPRADLFIDPLKARHPAAGHLLEALFMLAGAFACSIIVWATVPDFLRAWEDGEYFGIEGVFTFPTWPIGLIVLAGGALTTAQYLVCCANDLRAARTNGGHHGRH